MLSFLHYNIELLCIFFVEYVTASFRQDKKEKARNNICDQSILGVEKPGKPK